MTVSEPWEFGTGPVTMEILQTPNETLYLVSIRDGWPGIGETQQVILRTRYVGQTLSLLLADEHVSCTLGAQMNGSHVGLIGTYTSFGDVRKGSGAVIARKSEPTAAGLPLWLKAACQQTATHLPLGSGAQIMLG